MNTLKVVLMVAALLSPADLPLDAAASTRPGAGTTAKPNIVLMAADDLGYNDLGCYGASLVKTPRIDALARQGVRFTDAHSRCAICIPSRYSTLAEAAGMSLPQGASPDGSSELAAFLHPMVAPAKRTAALLHGSKGIVLRQGDWIYFPKPGSLGYTAPEPERPFGLPYAKMWFTNSDIDEHGQIKPGAPAEQFYNLATDLRQTKNLAAEQPDRLRAMRARFLDGEFGTGKK